MKKLLTIILTLALCASLATALAEVDPQAWIASFEELWAVLETDQSFAFDVHPQEGDAAARLSGSVGDVVYLTLEEPDEASTVVTFILRGGEVPDDVEEQARYDVYYAMAVANALCVRYPDMPSESRAATMLLLLEHMDALRYSGEEEDVHETAFAYEEALVSMWLDDDGNLMADLVY